jgi:hypothetical protein
MKGTLKKSEHCKMFFKMFSIIEVLYNYLSYFPYDYFKIFSLILFIRDSSLFRFIE